MSTSTHERDSQTIATQVADAHHAAEPRTSEAAEPESFIIPIAQHVTPAAIVTWLRAGWRDFLACFPRSAVFGACFAVMGLILMWVFNHAPAYLMALISGFLLTGPFVCTGCYELSRQIQAGEPLRLNLALCAFRACKKNIAIFAALLLVLELLWGRASLVVFAAFYQGALPDSKDVLKAFMTLQNVPFVVVYMLVGSIFATLVMIASVVSIPMMMDRRTDAITAALTSVRVCLRHPITLTIWGLTITALTVLAMLPYFLGLIVVGPWLGHASWHAYRALVPQPAALSVA